MWPPGPGPCFCRESADTLVVSLPRDHNISGSAVSAHRLPDAALFRRRSARLRRRRWRRRAGNGGARCPAARIRLLLLQEICRTFVSFQMRQAERAARRRHDATACRRSRCRCCLLQCRGGRGPGAVTVLSALREPTSRGAGIFFHAGLESFSLYAKDVYVKRTSSPHNSGGTRRDAQRPYALCISTRRHAERAGTTESFAPKSLGDNSSKARPKLRVMLRTQAEILT